MNEYFLSVDLDVESDEDLAQLIEDMKPSAITLNRGWDEDGYFASFELYDQNPETPDTIICALAAIVDKLHASKAIWDRASMRNFSITIEADDSSQTNLELAPETMRKMAAIGASMSVLVFKSEHGNNGVEEQAQKNQGQEDNPQYDFGYKKPVEQN